MTGKGSETFVLGSSFRVRACKNGVQLGSNKGAIRQHMLKISNHFNIKEAWEGLQRAGDTRNSSGLGSFEVPHEVRYYQKGFNESPFYDDNCTNIQFLLR